MGKIRSLLAIATILSVSPSAGAAVWYVDASVVTSGDGSSWAEAFNTIQGGIHASSHGDTIIVAEGTYLENIHFNGKNIVLRSTDPLDASVVSNTIIDGNQAGSVVTFSGDEDETCVLSGFTIRNGKARWGGGILGRGAGQETLATTENNIIEFNTADECGGGVARCNGTIANNIIQENCAQQYYGGGLFGCRGTMQHNTIVGNSARYGGAGLAECSGTMFGNTISYNFPTVHEALQGGGLFRCHGSIKGNVVEYNSAAEGGGLFYCGGTIEENVVRGNWAIHGSGGGLRHCDAKIGNNVITDNFAAESGGALSSCGSKGTITIEENLIAGNSAYSGGALSDCVGIISRNRIFRNEAYNGGGLDGCEGEIISNLICGNRAIRFGGGLYVCNGTIQNNTICGNSAHEGGGMYGDRLIRNCIFWGNRAANGPQLAGSTKDRFRHSCIQEWHSAREGNISADPLFVDPDGPDDDPETFEDNDYRLSPQSPCIDAGDISSVGRPGLDAEGNLRIAFGRDSLTVDMGAYEYSSRPFAVTRISSVDDGRIVIEWNSQPGDTYTIWRTDSLSPAQWIQATPSPVPSEGATTSYTLGAAHSSVGFYRVWMSR